MNSKLLIGGVFIAAAAAGFFLSSKYGANVRESVLDMLGGVPNKIVPLSARTSKIDMRAAAVAATTATPFGYGTRY